MGHPFAIGLDLGGTRLKAVAVAERRVIASEILDSGAAESHEAPLLAMRTAVDRLTTRLGSAPAAIGAGVPGAIDPDTGVLRGPTPHLPHWRDFPLRATLTERLGREVVVDNDANAAAWGEHVAGASRGARASLTVTVGTGIGGGIVCDGRLVRGAWGGAGELGHLPIGSGATPCPCGVSLCVEPEASGSGLVRMARERGVDAFGARDVFAAAASGDAAAAEVITHMTDRLGAAIAIAATIVNPEVIVLSGGVAEAGDALLVPVRRAFERHVLPSHRGARLELGSLGDLAGAVGAALLAWDAVAQRPAGSTTITQPRPS